MTKVCWKCKRKLGGEQFHKDRKAKDGLQNMCKECKRKWRKEYDAKPENRRRKLALQQERRKKNPEYQRNWQRGRYQENLKRIAKIKGYTCEVCREDFHPAALDYHHIDPSQKKFGIGQRLHSSWKIIKPELDKCMQVCANCHRVLHWNERHPDKPFSSAKRPRYYRCFKVDS